MDLIWINAEPRRARLIESAWPQSWGRCSGAPLQATLKARGVEIGVQGVTFGKMGRGQPWHGEHVLDCLSPGAPRAIDTWHVGKPGKKNDHRSAGANHGRSISLL